MENCFMKRYVEEESSWCNESNDSVTSDEYKEPKKLMNQDTVLLSSNFPETVFRPFSLENYIMNYRSEECQNLNVPWLTVTGATANYYNWREVYPQLQILLDNLDIIKDEVKNICKVFFIFSIFFRCFTN